MTETEAIKQLEKILSNLKNAHNPLWPKEVHEFVAKSILAVEKAIDVLTLQGGKS